MSTKVTVTIGEVLSYLFLKALRNHVIFAVYFLIVIIEHPTKLTEEGRAYFTLQFEGVVHCGEEGLALATGHTVFSRDGGVLALYSFSPFYSFWDSTCPHPR